MNEIKTKIKKIQSVDSIHVVTFDYKGVDIKMMSLELDPILKIDLDVEILVKPTHVTIAKSFIGLISHSNQLKSTIVKIDEGELVSVITVDLKDTFLQAIITSSSSKKMDLKIGEEVDIFIKSSDISILKVI